MAGTRACCIKTTYPAHPSALLSKAHEVELCKSTKSLNSFLVVGTHNSCHQASLFTVFIPYWRYTHPSFLVQLEAGLRHIEIDVWFNRSRRTFEIFHEGIDRLSSVQGDLLPVLQDIYEWSVRTDAHFPLCINLDIKGAYGGFPFKYFRYPNLNKNDQDTSVFHTLEAAIRSVWIDPARLFSPGTNNQTF